MFVDVSLVRQTETAKTVILSSIFFFNRETAHILKVQDSDISVSAEKRNVVNKCATRFWDSK